MSKQVARSLSVFVVAIFVAIAATASAQDSNQKLYRWFDVQSKQAVRAYFEGAVDGIVKLKTKNGESYSIAIDRLSSANKRLIKNLQSKANDPATETDDAEPHVQPDVNNAQPVARPLAGNLEKQKTMYGIRWQPVESLLTDQQVPDSENKPVFWFRVLGDLEGFM